MYIATPGHAETLLGINYLASTVEFQSSQEALQAKRRLCWEEERTTFTEEEEDMLWESGQPGDHTPEVIVYTSGTQVGEQRKVSLGAFQLIPD